MNQSTNYNFNLPEGTDIVNLLTQLIPNWSNLDSILKGVDDSTFSSATETVSLGVHAITRSNPDSKLLRWIATANFEAGDTFTIDGISTPAALPSGESLGEDAYIAGSVVLAALNADESALTVFVTSGAIAVAEDSNRLGGELPSYYATQSALNSVSGVANGAASAIALKNLVNTYYDSIAKKLYEVNADGTKGGEIVLGSQRNFVSVLKADPMVIDISSLENTDTITFGVLYNANQGQSEKATVATVKGWTTAHTIVAQSSAVINVTYSDGKITVAANASFPVTATVTFND